VTLVIITDTKLGIHRLRMTKTNARNEIVLTPRVECILRYPRRKNFPKVDVEASKCRVSGNEVVSTEEFN